MHKSIFYFILLVSVLSGTSHLAAQENELNWPREIQTGPVTITLYQPQPDTFKDNLLTGRMAFSFKNEESDLRFGAAFFEARMRTDLENRLVYLEGMDITQTTFPDVDPDKVEQFSRIVEKEMESWDVQMSLDHLLASMDLVEDQKEMASQLNNEPPEIYFRTDPAVLIMLDGDPIVQETENEGINYVVNTPYFIVQDSQSKVYYLKGGKWWYSSNAITSDWKSTDKVPKSIDQLASETMELDSISQDSAMMVMDTPPEIIVSTVPAELILTDGDPNYQQIEGTSLLYVENTENEIIMDINTQEHYILLSGRWYHSNTLQDGSWVFQEPDDLPEDFSKIPGESDMGTVRVSVPGTEEAQLAVLEQYVPQTAEVDRNTTTEVTYDGNPEFKKIDNTDVAYAVNSDKTVLLIKGKYYVVDEAIWFESDDATGPWKVCVNRPEEVDQIPPEESVYNTKYVYIYDSTPDVVYVGYYPGYTYSYVYHGVVVYGTGYYYHPWYRTYYYPRPVTYGFSVHYNPWTGWGFSFGVSYGWFSVGFHRSAYGWWGPAGYRRGYRHGYHRGYHRGYARGYAAGRRAGYARGSRAGYSRANQNVYRNRSGVRTANNVNRNRATNSGRVQSRPSTQPNNTYADRNGNVYRRQNNGNVQQRSGNSWQNSSGQRSQQVNRDHQKRQQGNRNYNNYNRSRSGARGAGRRR